MEFGIELGANTFHAVFKYHSKKPVPFDEFFYNVFREAHKQADQLIPKNFNNVECKKGCSHCCHLRVSTCIPELAAIYYHIITKWSKQEIKNLRVALLDYAAPEFLDTDYWIHTGTPCVFLSKENECKIYKIRPFVCRGMNSIEPEKCREGHEERKVLEYGMEGMQKLAFEGITFGIEKAMHKPFGNKVQQVELHQSLRLMLENPSLLGKWLLGQDYFEDLEVKVEI